MKEAFLRVARALNDALHIVPLLYGSLGLEQRLRQNLRADDIDILIPEVFLHDRWCEIVRVMSDLGYRLVDLHEHAFESGPIHCAFASLESLTPFAGVALSGIPIEEEHGVQYHLLSLEDYLKVYTASATDGYRKDVKNKNDAQKIALIKKRLGQGK